MESNVFNIVIRNARDERAKRARVSDNVDASAWDHSRVVALADETRLTLSTVITVFFIYVLSLPGEHILLGGNASFPFVCTISECKLLSLKGNLPHTMANKITPL